MSSEKKNGQVVALEFEDDGEAPFYTTEEFMKKVVKMGVKNKIGVKGVNGEAGIGAKDGAAFLGSKFIFSWSPGNGKEFSLTFVRNGWTGRATENINNDYDGPSYFKIRIEELNGDIRSPNAVRATLSYAFSSALERHSNVNIYTCKKENVKAGAGPLLPSPPEALDPNFPQWEGVINSWHGIPITARVGKLLEAESPQPTIVISKLGVKYVNGFEKNVADALFTSNKTNRPLRTTHNFRGIHISIDCSEIEATTIKNKIQWDSSPTNRSMIAAVADDERFYNVWREIYIQHQNLDDGKTNERVLPAAVKNKINELQDRGAIDLNEAIKTSDISATIIDHNDTDKSSGSTRKYAPRVTKSGKRNKNKDNTTKNKNLVKVNGKNKPFEIVEIDECDDERKTSRGWLDSREDKILLMVNKSYEGYTPEIEKDETSKLPLYIAETMGYVFHNERQTKLVEDGKATPESLKELNKKYEKDTGKYIKIMTASSKVVSKKKTNKT